MQDRSGDNVEKRFTAGDWRVEPDTLRIVRGGVEKRLEPKVMQVLVHLAHHGGEVVSREQLESTVWRGVIVGYDAFLKGWQYLWRYTREDNAQAREYYLKVIELDPDFARAYANLAVTHAFDYMNGWSDDPQDTLEQANTYIEEAVRLDERLPQVHWAVGIVNTYAQNYEVAIRAAEKAIAQSPNFADGYGLLATVLNYAGKPEEARQVMHKAMRLNPRHPFITR
jgi:tetratricopeptide (TPR) repeat protein